MKRILWGVVWITFLFSTAGFCAEITIRVPEGNTYPPFFIQNQNGNWTGLSIELVEALLKEAGHTPVYVPLPFSRGLKNIQSGHIHMMLNLTITKERESFTYFIGPQLDETILLVTLKENNFSITSIDDLKKLPYSIGVERGKLYSDSFEKKRATDKNFYHHLEEVTNIDRNEKKLKAGHISGFLGYGYNIFHQIKTNPLYNNFMVHSFVLGQDWVYFGFSKTSITQKQLHTFQEAFNRASEKGIFEAIKQRYRQ